MCRAGFSLERCLIGKVSHGKGFSWEGLPMGRASQGMGFPGQWFSHGQGFSWEGLFIGSVFCSGLDLDAIYGKAEAHNSSIPNSKKKILLGQILTEVHKPIISKVEGNVYAGGYIYLACSTYVIASDDLEFSLPEVKRGIFPMQVMGLLMRIMTPRNIIDWCIRGYSLSAKKAKKWGLISKAVPLKKIDEEVECSAEC